VHVARDLELRSESWRAMVSPERGGRLRWWGEAGAGGREPWIRPMLLERGRMVGGCMARMAVPSLADPEDLARAPDPAMLDEPWQLAQRTMDTVTLMQHHRGPSPGTWGYQASQTLRLQQNRLEWTLSMRNLGRHPMPVRLGWRLQFAEDFARELVLDEDCRLVQPARGHVESRETWRGLATLAGPGGRHVLLRGDPPVTTLDFERHPTRASLHLDLMTPGGEALTPLPRGEELTLRLTLDLMVAKRPPPTGRPAPTLL
jgi:hypothetical protein